VIFFFLCNSICVCSRCMMSIAHGCALVVSGVMIHGRIYMTERNIYFRANIVGIVTKVSCGTTCSAFYLSASFVCSLQT
jgi:hypothetical protein